MTIKDEKIADQILAAVGGSGNIVAVENCMTRLRFDLKDDSKASKGTLEKIEGVKGVVFTNGQCQVVMGGEANDVYKIFLKNGTISEGKDAKGAPKGKTRWFDAVMDTLMGSITPVISLLMASGLILALANLLAQFNVIPSDSGLYVLLSSIGNACFFFLPVFLGYFSAKKMGTNAAIGMFLGAILVYPSLSETIAGETGLNLFGLTVPAVTYSSTIIPILLIVWALSYVEKFVDKIMPKSTKNTVNPMIIILIMVPFALLVVGPLGDYVGKLLNTVFGSMVGTKFGWIAVGLLGLVYPLLVGAGAHLALLPILMNSFAMNGYDTLIFTAGAAYNMACAGTALAIALKSKNSNLKSTAYSGSLSAFLGVSEPALFGIVFRIKRAIVGVSAGGLAGGLVAGLLGFKVYTFMLQGLYTLPTYIDGGNNLFAAIATFVVATVVAFAVTYIYGFDDLEEN
jgi:PTS system beta-glucosides-specific IIC component